MNEIYERLQKALQYIRRKIDFVPEIGVVLGSGLGDFAENIEIVSSVPYKDIEGFPISTVDGHKGRFVFGYCENIPVVLMQGRVHYYEGYDMCDVVMPTRLMGLMGIKTIILTNAAGGIDPDFSIGDLMLIKNQIASFVPSPLRGRNISELGPRFPDMSGLYNEEDCKPIRMAAKQIGIQLKEGTYVQLPGPNFESSAEIKMCSILGGSAVGMSTACEAIAARHMGVKVCGVSLITNMAAGISKLPQTNEEVNENASAASDKFCKLIHQTIINIHNSEN